MSEGEGSGKFKREKLKKKEPEAELFEPTDVQLPAVITSEAESRREELQLPQADKETNIYTDDAGLQWASLRKLSELFGLGDKALFARIHNLPTTRGRVKSGNVADLYPIEQARQELGVFLELVKVDLRTGFYTDPNGKVWSTATRLSRLFQVSIKILQDSMAGLDSQQGRGVNGEEVTLYSEDLVREKLADRLRLPRVAKDTGIYLDERGVQWTSLARIAEIFTEKYQLGRGVIEKHLEGVERLPGRGKGGEAIDLLPINAVRDRMREIIELPVVDSETGIYADAQGEQWASVEQIVRFFHPSYGIGKMAIRPRLQGLRKLPGRAKNGLVTLYPLSEVRQALIELTELPLIRDESGIFVDSKGKEWATKSRIALLLAADFDVSHAAIIPRLRGLETMKVRATSGVPVTLYPVHEAREIVREFAQLPKADPETGIYTDSRGNQWASLGTLAKINKEELSVGRTAIMVRLSGIATVRGRDGNGKAATLYSMHQIREAIREISELPMVSKDSGIYTDASGKQWAPLSTIAELFTDQYRIGSTAMLQRIEGLEQLPGRSKAGESVVMYSIEEVRVRIGDLIELPRVNGEKDDYIDSQGTRWMTIAGLAEELSVGPKVIESYIRDHRSVKVRTATGVPADFYSLADASAALQEFLQLPKVDIETGIYVDDNGLEWAGHAKLAQIFNTSRELIDTYLKRVSSIKGVNRAGRVSDLYSVAAIREILPSLPVERNDLVIKDSLKEFLTTVTNPSQPHADSFGKLVAMCGSSRSIDILFKFRPDYKKIPIDYVKNVLAEYLGDYLAVKRPFRLNDITPEIAQHFSDLTLKEGLKETIKQDCLSFYYKERRQGSNKSDRKIIEAYFDHAVNELGDLNNTDIDDVVEEVVQYFNTLFASIERPRDMVERLGDERREFPDVNQRINYQELKDKKRLLIADEMGLGKSGSVIFAKEALRVKQAVLVVPSNVIPTWQKYLSDSRADGGYFKAGLPPSVLTVESVEALQRAGVGDQEYIIISHERISDPRYVAELLKLDIGMLVVDEMHLLKNLAGKRAEQLVVLSQKIEGEDKYLALLSGTPVPNTVKDIAMTLKLLYPEKFGETEDRNLVSSILKGDLLDLRSLLLPRMQMKSLRESVEMPELKEAISYTELVGLERDIYEMLLEEDELSPMVKLQTLRQFLLNPELVDPTPGLESSKIELLNQSLAQIYQTKKKVVVFVNGYVEDILRGERGIASKLHLPAGVEFSTIHGEVSKEERVRLQGKLKEADRKMLLLISGQTAGVGVDFSSADEVIFYNEPWTKYEKGQQLSRVFRPGLMHDLSSSTLIGKGTIEEGIHKHIEAKYKSIEKLLNGIPLTEIEQDMLKAVDEAGPPTAEVNPELARYYFSSWERMMNIFAHVKEIGETNFQEFLEKFSREYADCYMELGTRSYQANANRVTGSLIAEMAKESGRAPDEVTILDTASGPEMLKRHIPDSLRERVISMDINRAHFAEGEGKRVVGSFLHIPLKPESVDFAAMTLAWHYTNFVPSQGKIERVEALKELHSVLKLGGKAVLNLMYSLDIRKPEELKPALELMGFRVVEELSGDIIEGDRYASKVLTIEKAKENTQSPQEIVDALIAQDLVDGLKFRQNKKGLRNSRGILTSFVLNGQKHDIALNEADSKVYEEERSVLEKGAKLRDSYESIQDIPREEVIKEGFSRVFNGKRYVLFSKLSTGPGVVVIK